MSGQPATDPAMLRAMPTAFVLPMLSLREVSWGTATRSSEGDDRLDELDARIEAIHLRLSTVQRTVELQTKLLEELKLQGTIGGQPLPAMSPATVTPVPSAAEASVPGSVHAALQEAVKALEDYRASTPEAGATHRLTPEQISEFIQRLKQFQGSNAAALKQLIEDALKQLEQE